jgi:hypothetical protein
LRAAIVRRLASTHGISCCTWKVSQLYAPSGQFVHQPPPSPFSAMSGITTIIGKRSVVCSALPFSVQSEAPPLVPCSR